MLVFAIFLIVIVHNVEHFLNLHVFFFHVVEEVSNGTVHLLVVSLEVVTTLDKLICVVFFGFFVI